MVRPVVHSRKHIVQFSIAGITAGGTASKTISIAVAHEDKDQPTEVVEGSSIKAIYVELWVTSDDNMPGSGIFLVQKRPANLVSVSAGDFAALDQYANKKNIFEIHQGLFPEQGQNPINIYRHWIKIPKGKQRQGLGDILTVELFAQSNGISFCGFATYKEYT